MALSNVQDYWLLFTLELHTGLAVSDGHVHTSLLDYSPTSFSKALKGVFTKNISGTFAPRLSSILSVPSISQNLFDGGLIDKSNQLRPLLNS